MNLMSSVAAYMLVFMISLALVSGLSALVIVILPATKIFVGSVLLPLSFYANKQLLDWSQREF